MQTREVSESGSARTSSTPQAPVAPTSRGSAAARAQGANKASPSSAAATGPDSVSRTEDSPSLDVRSVFAVNDKSGQKARRSNIGKALRSGEEVSFKSEQGTRHSVEVSKGEPVDGKDGSPSGTAANICSATSSTTRWVTSSAPAWRRRTETLPKDRKASP